MFIRATLPPKGSPDSLNATQAINGRINRNQLSRARPQRRCAFLDFARFLGRTNSGFGRGAPGMCSGFVRMIAAMRSLNSSTLSTRGCSFMWPCVMNLSGVAQNRCVFYTQNGVGSAYGSRTHFQDFANFARIQRKLAAISALEGKLQIRAFARIAQIYAVRVSDFVRKTIDRFYGSCSGGRFPRAIGRQNRF